jgi:hypothetical protein
MIGVGVEGRSDYLFWDKVLHKHFRPRQFDIRSTKSRSALIRDTPQMLEDFRDLHYDAGFILLDADELACPRAAIDLFAPHIQVEVTKPLTERFLFLCIAIRGLESWLLADGAAIRSVLPKVAYSPPQETGAINPKEVITVLWRQQYGRAAFNKIDFAARIAPRFDPEAACGYSASFTHFWTRISSRARP